MAEPHAVNIAHHGGLTSNYKLRGEPVKLHNVAYRWYVPDGDGWAPALLSEEDVSERHRSAMRLRGSRKQRAARAAVPLSSVTIVTENKPVAPGVAKAIYEGKSEVDIRVAELEAQIEAIRRQLRRPNPVPMPGEPVLDIDGLLEAYELRRPR